MIKLYIYLYRQRTSLSATIFKLHIYMDLNISLIFEVALKFNKNTYM